jgi:LytS/YehU family sensor histidine kinase
MKLLLRRLRGALGNALVWGVGWFAAGLALILGLALIPPVTPLEWGFWRYALGGAASIATVGAITGGAFSAYVAATYRDKRLGDLNPARFAVWGGVVSIMMALVIVSLLNADSGWPLRLAEVIPTILISGTLGGLTGFGSIRMAQRGLLAEGDQAPELKPESKRFRAVTQ